MCGIVGAIARRNVVPILVEGLKRLEYRGYDSAGIAVLDGDIKRVRRVGRVAEMENAAAEINLSGQIGLLAYGGIFRSPSQTEVAHHDIAGMNSDPDLQGRIGGLIPERVHLIQLIEHLQGGVGR